MKHFYRLLLALVAVLTLFCVTAFALTITKFFPDVEKGAWYETPINNVSSMNVMNGYLDGKFGPNDPVTRAQLATVINAYNEKIISPLTFQLGKLHQKGRLELTGSSFQKYISDMYYYQLEYSTGDEGEPPYDKNEEYFKKIPAGWVLAYDGTEKIGKNYFGTKIIALDGWKTESPTWFYLWYNSEIGISGVSGFFYDDVGRLVEEVQPEIGEID